MLRKFLKLIFVSINIVNVFKKNTFCKIILIFNLSKLSIRKKNIKRSK
jgi:hypothetical protein